MDRNWNHLPLKDLLDPVGIEDFKQGIFGREPLHIPDRGPGAPKFSRLFDWESLNRLLNLGPEAGAGLRLFQDQRNFLYKKAPENLRHVLAQLRQGGTLILEDIDRLDERLAVFADAFSDELSARTRINLYLSYPGQAGYPIHYDTHDFLILQIHGHKRWEVYPATIPSPLVQPPQQGPGEPVEPRFTPPPPASRLLEVLLSPGDVLYVPKGFWHQAMAEGEPSLHLTLGFFARTGIDLLQWLLGELREQPGFRREFPLLTKQDLPRQATDPSPFAPHFAGLQAELARLLADPALLWKFHQAGCAELPRRQGFALPHQYAASPADLAACSGFRSRSVPHYLSLAADGSLELVYPKEKLCFAAAAEPLLRFLLETESFSRDEILTRFPAFGWQAILEVIFLLVQDGLLVPLDGQSAQGDG